MLRLVQSRLLTHRFRWSALLVITALLMLGCSTGQPVLIGRAISPDGSWSIELVSDCGPTTRVYLNAYDAAGNHLAQRAVGEFEDCAEAKDRLVVLYCTDTHCGGGNPTYYKDMTESSGGHFAFSKAELLNAESCVGQASPDGL